MKNTRGHSLERSHAIVALAERLLVAVVMWQHMNIERGDIKVTFAERLSVGGESW